MNASGARIVVLGETLVDVFPDAKVAGGAPFNVARNLHALGADCRFVTRLGRDAAGDALERGMRALGMDLAGVQRDDTHATGTVHVRVEAGEPRYDIAADVAWDHVDTSAATAAVDGYAPGLVYFGTLAQRSPASRAAIRAVLARPATMRVLDLNLRGLADEREVALDSLALADIAKVNADELERVLAWTGGDVAVLMRRFDLVRLVVTRGPEGWSCHERDGATQSGPAPRNVIVRDTVGAGDAFAAVMLLGLARGWPHAAALGRAATFAAQACTLRGAFDPGSPIYAAARSAWAPLPRLGSDRRARTLG